MDTCKDPYCKSAGTDHGHIELSQRDIDTYQAIHEAAQMHHMGAEVERTRTVNVHDHADLLDHLRSNNGHIMGKYANYRNSHDDEHIPGVRPQDPNWDHELTHKELIALHHHDHMREGDPHTTLNGEHFHH